jgi:hypothetical protein
LILRKQTIFFESIYKNIVFAGTFVRWFRWWSGLTFSDEARDSITLVSDVARPSRCADRE